MISSPYEQCELRSCQTPHLDHDVARGTSDFKTPYSKVNFSIIYWSGRQRSSRAPNITETWTRAATHAWKKRLEEVGAVVGRAVRQRAPEAPPPSAKGSATRTPPAEWMMEINTGWKVVFGTIIMSHIRSFPPQNSDKFNCNKIANSKFLRHRHITYCICNF